MPGTLSALILELMNVHSLCQVTSRNFGACCTRSRINGLMEIGSFSKAYLPH